MIALSNHKATLAIVLACMSMMALASVTEGGADEAAAKKEEVKVVHYIFKEECFDAFFVRKDFSDLGCIGFTLSKLVGFAIVGGSAILKVPQIINILKAGSSEGVSSKSYYFETIVFVNTMSNARH